MIKCIHDECCWPECDKTCGLTPTGNYEAGSSAEESPIHHLQCRIDELLAANEEFRQKTMAAKMIVRSLEKSLWIPTEEEVAYEKVCLHGWVDCIHNPEYIRRNYPEWWVELGMPTECTEESCYYDDEDK